jgi:2-polyprenyl-3-methyl-5-hydroxy-6-metoxy-1,4-benzoquinol methylase
MRNDVVQMADWIDSVRPALGSRDFPGALKIIAKVNAQDPQYLKALCYQAILFIKLHNAENAMMALDQALKIDSRKTVEYLGSLVGTIPVTEDGDYSSAVLTHLMNADRSACVRLIRLAAELILAKLEPEFPSGTDGLLDQAEPEGGFSAAEELALSNELLLCVLKAVVIPSVRLEMFLTAFRKKLLLGYVWREPADPRVTRFVCNLAQQCYLNEFVYFETDDEKARLQKLRTAIAGRKLKKEETELNVLLLSMYQPVEAPPALVETLDAQDSSVIARISEVHQATVGPCRLELNIRKSIRRVGDSHDTISAAVAAQYEDNPYPRWATLATPRPGSAREMLSRFFVEDELIDFADAARVLIAGCGTGRHSISSAIQYGHAASVVALDLSASSLAYAIRKTREFSLNNIEYLQMDLIHLDQLKREFDVIECVGVLHHMNDPLQGLRCLRDHLRPNGLMKIGLYSEIARLPIAFARRKFGSDGHVANSDEIRAFRRTVMSDVSQYWAKAIVYPFDFYSLSDCRDLLFHVHERCVSIELIRDWLSDLGLRFCGFDVHAECRKQYGMRFPDDPLMRDLDKWTRFESANPTIFDGMYNFWCLRQK